MKRLFILAAVLVLCGCLKSATAQEVNFLHDRIMVDGLYKRNIGNFSSVWSNAAGAYLSYGIAFPEHNLLVFRTGVVSNSLREGVEYDGASSTFVPLHIGGRYYFSNATVMPFFSFMNGVNLIFENTNLEGDQKSRMLLKYAWEVGVGVTVNLNQALALDARANYQSFFYEAEAMMTGFEYTLGLAWNFPG
jgi:hypothetical protein